MSATELLTPTEAAVVAGVEVRDVNRMIDEEILPSGLYRVDGGRRLQANACVFVAFYVHAADKLTAKERSNVILTASKGSKANRYFAGEYRDDFLIVDLAPFASETEIRHVKLGDARKAVVEDPDVMGGVAVFKGTRVPVRDVAASLRKGISKERLLKAYPALTKSLLELALVYADAVPARGRPKRAARPEGITKIVRRKPRS